MTLLVRAIGNEVTMQILDAQDSPWGETPVIGRMMSRNEALSSPLMPMLFRVADFVVTHDEIIGRFLEAR